MGILKRIFGRKDRQQATFAYARLNARVMPIDRGERYEDPLSDALSRHGFGGVTGGGTLQATDGEIEYCGLDLELLELERAVPFVCDFLSTLGAPRGSMLEYEVSSRAVEVPFGILEGLAIYLNGTDLPDEVYEQGDANQVYEDLSELLAGRGEIQGHWRGPTETALYLYGHSATEMRELISKGSRTDNLVESVSRRPASGLGKLQDTARICEICEVAGRDGSAANRPSCPFASPKYLEQTPICQRARIVQIA